MLFLRAPARDGSASFVLSCLSSRPVERSIRCMWIRLYACTYEWWYILFCDKVRIVYMCMHVGVNEYAASVCMYEGMIEYEYRFHTPLAASRPVNAGEKNVCMYACIQLNMVLVLVPSNWMWMLAKLVVCVKAKRAISVAVRLADLLEKALYIHTYMHVTQC